MLLFSFLLCGCLDSSWPTSYIAQPYVVRSFETTLYIVSLSLWMKRANFKISTQLSLANPVTSRQHGAFRAGEFFCIF